MKKILVVSASAFVLLGCSDPNSPFFKGNFGTENSATTETVAEEVSDAAEVAEEVSEDVEEMIAEVEEAVEAAAEEAAKQCLTSDVLSNDFEVIDPGTQGEIVTEGSKTYFLAGGNKYDVTGISVPTAPC